jgi:hypothetical protein
MDYANYFFNKISKVLFQKVHDEIIYEEKSIEEKKIEECSSTNWLHEENKKRKRKNLIFESEAEYWKSQAKHFVQNYIMLVTNILDYLLFREANFEYIRNFEFFDAVNRLTDSKIELIINLGGIFKMNRTVESVLDTISFF